MKKLVIFTFILAFSIPLFAQKQKVNWYSFEKAVEMNKKEPRKILVDVYTDWCGWCKKMKKNTFNHPKIAEYINNHFYAVRFNAESNKKVTFKGKTFVNNKSKKKRPHQLAIALLRGKMSYPSVAYLNENNQLITTVPGYYGPKEMEPLLNFIKKDAYKNQSFKEFKKNFSGSFD
jgi:thioredoxin-related protein